MSQLKLTYLVLIICSIPLLFSCEDKEENFNGLTPAETNKIYTNKIASASPYNQLELNYSNLPLLGKNVYFEIINSNLAQITLIQVIPGEEKTSFEIKSLSEIKGGGYTFTGNNTTEKGTSFSYAGSIQENKLTLNLQDITLSANILSSERPWYNIQTVLDWQITGSNLTWSIVSPLLSNLLNNLLLSVLNEITFSPDGNVIATYAPLPEEAEITEMLTGSINYNDRNPEDWQTSPGNMAIYYVEGEKLYIIPQIEMLMEKLLPQNKTKAETEDILNTILNVLNTTSQWINKGIEFTINEINPQKISVTLDKSQLEFLFPLIPYISPLIPVDGLPETIGELLEELLLEASFNTSVLNLTITLSQVK